MSVIKLITKGFGVVEKILEKGNTKENRKYLEEWKQAKVKAIEAENAVEDEKAKPQEDQFDSVVEHFEKEQKQLEKLADVLEKVADKELERMLAKSAS